MFARGRLLAAFVAVLFGVLVPAGVAQATWVVRDSFTGNNIAVTARYPTLPSGADPSEGWFLWQKSTAPSLTGTFVLSANRAYAPSFPAVLTSNRQLPSNDYDVQGQLYVMSNNTGNVNYVGATGLVGRADPTTDSMYVGRYNSGTSKWELLRCEPTGCTLLDSSATQTLNVGSLYDLSLSMRDDAKRLYVNGTQVLYSTDNSITRIGRAGIRQMGTSASPTTGYHIGSFGISVPGTFVWKADGDHGGPTSEWNSSCSYPDSGNGVSPPNTNTNRLQWLNSSTSSYVAQGARSYQSLVDPGDLCGGGERAEWAQGNPPNYQADWQPKQFADLEPPAAQVPAGTSDNWTSFQVYLPPSMDVDSDHWKAIAQWHQAGSLGTPVLALDVANGHLKLDHSKYQNDTQENVDPPLWTDPNPVAKGQWIKFSMHVRWSADPNVGFVELWGNPAGGAMTRLLPSDPNAPPPHMWTLKIDDTLPTPAAVPTHARIGIYRERTTDPLHPLFGEETAVYDGYTVATKRDAAEALAFAPPWP